MPANRQTCRNAATQESHHVTHGRCGVTIVRKHLGSVSTETAGRPAPCSVWRARSRRPFRTDRHETLSLREIDGILGSSSSAPQRCGVDRFGGRGPHRGFFRGFGIRRYTLLAGSALAALNILNLHDWATRREVLDSWGRFLGEPEPERRPRRRRRRTLSATRPAASLAATGPGR